MAADATEFQQFIDALTDGEYGGGAQIDPAVARLDFHGELPEGGEAATHEWSPED